MAGDRPTRAFLLPLLLAACLLSHTAAARSFRAEGSDLVMGIGADAIGRAGAVTATTDNIHAIFWNPAGLAEMQRSELSISGQPTARFLPVNFVGLGLTGDRLAFLGLKSTVALAWVPRVYVKSSGAYSAGDFESMFIRFALPGLAGDFEGDLQSKTKDLRISWAITPAEDPSWSLGATVARVDCKSLFCGVTANKPGVYTVSTARAVAWAVNLGGKYFVNDKTTLGFNLKDIDTRLNVALDVRYADGTQIRQQHITSLPRDLTLGFKRKESAALNWSIDLQFLYGEYGTYKMDFRILRAGIEYSHRNLHYRGGIIIPLRLAAEQAGNISDRLPAPVLPTLGIGTTFGNYQFDAAFYPHPIMSAQRNRFYPVADLTLIAKF